MNREQRRALPRYRRVDRTAVCPECGANLGATFVLEPADPDPSVVFRHNPDGTHLPVISGTSMAAQSLRSGQVIGQASSDNNRRSDA